MKKIFTILLLLCAYSSLALAQKASVSGIVMDGALNEPLTGAAVVLLNQKDSTQATGVVTDINGKFSLNGVKSGSYIMRITFMGYLTQYKNIDLSRKSSLDAGTITLQEDAKMMKEAEVTAKLAQVEMKEDTFVYNADAYRLPEGSALEELVKKLPGAEVDEDGTIKINGKTVSKIMVEGKEFFSSDTKMAMKNLPSKMVKKIKSYDKKSDYSRVTGIDDGEEETVLDLTVQKGMRDGWLVNVDLAGGTEDRYSLKANVNRFTDHLQLSLIGSRNNVNDNGFPGGGGRGWGGGNNGGITTSNMAGFNFAWENGKPQYSPGYLEMGGNIRYSSSKSTTDTRTNSETFLNDTTSTFANSLSHSVKHSANINANFRLEWQPDSATNITFRPNFSHSSGDNFSHGISATFNKNPYEAGMTNPLDEYRTFDDVDSIRVNDKDHYNFGESYSNKGDADLQINRQLGKAGRNLTLNLGASYSKSHSESYSRSLVYYFQTERKTATYQNTFSPSVNYNYQAKISYSEPIFKGANIQMSYQAQRRYQDQNRTMLSYADLADYLDGLGITYTAQDLYMNTISGMDGIDMVKDLQNSQYATYNELNQDATVMFRYTNKLENGQEMRFNAGLSYQPQTTHMDYAKSSIDTTITRHTQNWSPRVDVRWKISNSSMLRVRYNGRMSQPSMTNLIEVMDTSDPLNISTGNAGLESSWSDRFFAFYNNYVTEKQRGWAMNFNGNVTRRSIANATIYDRESGAKYGRPMNIDGNWNVGTFIMFNTAIGEKKKFNFSTHTNLNYSNNVGYISSEISSAMREYISTQGLNLDYLFKNTLLNKATTKNTTVGENIKLNYRDELGANNDYSIDLGINSGMDFRHARNKMQKNANLDTWTYSYGGNITFSTPFNLSFSSDISQQCRLGYEDESMNNDELVWNAQLSQNMKKWIKGHDLTISVQWYDILRQRSNISRAISATMRSDTWTNAINSYVMVHVIYKLNLMGNKEARSNMGPGFGGPGGGFGGPGGGGQGGGNRGGGGGGRF